MKKGILLSTLLFYTFFNTHAQSKFDRAFNEVLQVVNNATGSLQSVTTQTIEVNSIAKARFSNGHTRQVVPIHLPRGTQRWWYRITVMDVSSNYSYSNNETFYYDLANRVPTDNMYRPTNSGIDFFLLQTSGDATTFCQTGNNNFTYIDGYYRPQSNSFIGEGLVPYPDNLWIGIRNDNKVDGLRVIVEVVAWGHFY